MHQHFIFLIFILFNLFICLRGVFVAARAFSSCSKQGLLFVAVASLVAEHRL